MEELMKYDTPMLISALLRREDAIGIIWVPEDLKDTLARFRMDTSDEEVAAFMRFARKSLIDRSTEFGWELLDDLAYDYERIGRE